MDEVTALRAPAATAPPLRIAQIGPTRYRGGVTVAVTELAIGLARAGQSVVLIGNGHGEDTDAPARFAEAGAAYREIDAGGRRRLVDAVLRLRRVFAEFRPDIVHVHGRWLSLVSTLAGRRPDWFTLHNSHLTERAGVLDAGVLRGRLSPLGRRVVALDSVAADYLHTTLRVARDAIAIVPNGVDCERFRPPTAAERTHARARLGVAEDETAVLFLGRFHAQKQPLAVPALADAARRAGLGHVVFALVGEGPSGPAVAAEIARLGLGAACRVHGWRDPREALWAADLLVMPSLYEGYGLVAAEALACGCPVVRTRSGGWEAMIREGVTGWATDLDEAGFVATALDALRRPERLAAMRGPARGWALERLSRRRQIEMMLAAYAASLPATRAGASVRAPTR